MLIALFLVGCIEPSKNPLCDEVCFCIKFSVENSNYNEFFIDNDRQYFFDGRVGEVFNVLKDTSEHFALLEEMNNTKKDEKRKDLLINYIKLKMGKGNKTLPSSELIMLDNCNIGIEEFKKNAHERMLLSLPTSRDKCYIIDTDTIEFVD